MSALARQNARTRRAEQGTVTEMARLLLRDAREAAVDAAAIESDGEAGRGAMWPTGSRVRRVSRGTPARLRPRPLAARRA